MNKAFIVVITIVVSVLTSAAMVMWGEQKGVFHHQMTEDEVAKIAAEVVDSINEPTFANAGEVLAYRDNLTERANEDYSIMEMSANALTTVTDVLISRKIEVSPKTICREFYDHQEIYEKIPQNAPKSVVDSIVVDTAFVKGECADMLNHETKKE